MMTLYVLQNIIYDDCRILLAGESPVAFFLTSSHHHPSPLVGTIKPAEKFICMYRSVRSNMRLTATIILPNTSSLCSFLWICSNRKINQHIKGMEQNCATLVDGTKCKSCTFAHQLVQNSFLFLFSFSVSRSLSLISWQFLCKKTKA